MLTTREAARLLIGDAQDPPARRLAALARAVGFADPLRLGRPERRALALGDAVVDAWVAGAAGEHAPGVDGLRALLCTLPPPASPAAASVASRDAIAQLARGVARASSANLWLVIALDAATGAVTVAAPPPGGVGATPLLTADPARIMDSDAETFAALAALRADAPGVALLAHLRWREVLGRDALSNRFYRELEACVGALASTASGRADARERRSLALLATSRLLFLAFLEAKGWLDGDRGYLRRRFEASCGGRGAHHRLLLPLFFGTLNTPPRQRASAALALGRVPFLNGGLFTRTPLERRHRDLRFTDEALGDVIGGLLGRYRLTARETGRDWSDAAVDPEMLGRAFESLMHTDDRRASGTFYTPQALIVRLAGAALQAHAPLDTLDALDAVRVLDPACGSGAFLVHALEELAERRRLAGDRRPPGARRRHVLVRSIFGVDIDATATWLCQLRLWLSVVVDDDAEAAPEPLPNLDRNVRQGDALAGVAFGDDALASRPTDAAIERLRLRYARSSGARKRTLMRALDRAERAAAIAAGRRELDRLGAARRDLLAAVRGPDLFRSRAGPDAAQRAALAELRARGRAERRALDRLRGGGALPFAWRTHFPGVAAEGGFSLVIGNPPWVRPHAIAATSAERDAMRARFITARQAAWQAGAEAAGAGRAFASQADLAALFTERSVDLARGGGVVAMLLPSKLWLALAGGGLRELLARAAPVVAVEDWSDETTGFDAAVYPSSIVARRVMSVADRAASAPAEVDVTVHRRGTTRRWRSARGALALDASPGAPWLLLPPAARTAHARLEAAGVPLGASALGRPLLGVKSGCNEAFVVERLGEGASGLERVRSGAHEDVIERSVLRPVLRGESLRAWTRDSGRRESILWTHDERGTPLAALPAGSRRWLARWRRRLEQRADCRGRGRWWTLFRTEAARVDRPRVVWGDIGRAPRAIVLARGDVTVPLNSCYVVPARSDDDAHALAALLNSRLALAWLMALAEPARGGYRRFLGWTCARLPVPADWPRARSALAPLGRAAAGGVPPDDDALDDVLLRAYGIARDDVEALLAWARDATA